MASLRKAIPRSSSERPAGRSGLLVASLRSRQDNGTHARGNGGVGCLIVLSASGRRSRLPGWLLNLPVALRTPRWAIPLRQPEPNRPPHGKVSDARHQMMQIAARLLVHRHMGPSPQTKLASSSRFDLLEPFFRRRMQD